MKRLLSLLLLVLALQVNADNTVLSKPNLKILILGNSYMYDGLSHLDALVNGSGSNISDMCIYRMLRSDASFKTWCDMYKDNDTNEYYFTKVLGGISSKVKQAAGSAGDGSLLREVLTSDEWDLILLQPSSKEATSYETWKDEGYLEEFLDILKAKQPNAEIGIILIHSYWDNYVHNSEGSSYDRWQLIANAVKKLVSSHDINFVLPYGTAIENLRMSTLNNDYDLTRDGTQLAYGLGRYAASCCYYEALIAPRSGISVAGNPTRYNVPTTTSSLYPTIDVTDDNAYMAQRAAVLAMRDAYTCNNPDVPDAPAEETITITDTQGDGYGVCTFSSFYDLDFSEISDNEFKAYISAGYNAATQHITVVHVKDAPAGTGLIIKGKAGTYKVSCSKSLSYYTNMLVGTPVRTWVTQTSGIYTNLVLSKRNGIVGFYTLSNDGYVNANKAYLQIPTQLIASAQSNQIGIIYEDDAPIDGISEKENNTSDEGYYTLTGIKVEHPEKGIYIHRGKKVVVK
jgi:hypothetical protein